MAIHAKLSRLLPRFQLRELTKTRVSTKSTKKDSGSASSSASPTLVTTPDYKRLVEMVVFAWATPLVGVFLFKGDPLGLNSGFPWAVVGPVVFAARYGVTWGAVCALAAVIAILYPHAAYAGQIALTITLAVGTVILAIIVGDASTNWRKRASQSSAENQYLRHRLKEFSNDYHVLKVSHGQLEEYMAGQKLSLRQALQQLKPVLSTTNKEGLQAGEELMAVFAQFCSVQVAGLYAMKNESVIDPQAVAIHGNMGELPTFDRILNAAVKESNLVSIKLETLAEDKHSDGLLAAVPIADSNDRIHGVLAIRDMHFMAFQQENLNLLSLLAGYIGDMLSRSRGMQQSRGAWFMAELDTALRFAQTHSVQSALLCMRLKRFDKDEEVADLISTNMRSLDASWMPKTKDGSFMIVVLLPLVTEMQAEGYVARLAGVIEKQYDLGLDKIVRDCRVMKLDSSIKQADCMAFLQGKPLGKRAVVKNALPSAVVNQSAHAQGDSEDLESSDQASEESKVA